MGVAGLDAEHFPYLEAVVSFMVVVYLFHTYLVFRQYKAILLPEPPKYLAHHYTEESYKKQQAYNVDKWWFGLVQGIFSTTLSVAMLLGGYLPWLWQQASIAAARLPTKWQGEITTTILFVLFDSGVQMVLGLPWSLYSTFVIEQRHGFNKQTLRLFITDRIKQIVLGLVLMPPILAAITWLLLHTGPYVALYLWAFILILSLVFMTIYPTLIQPLFNKFTPLKEGELRDAIEELAGGLKFPLTKLYVIDGSTRSAHSNAYMYGFFKNKRIVLFDTLIEQCSSEQVVAVLAHELGHWKLRHTPILFVTQQLVLLCQLSLFTLIRTNKALYAAFGFVSVQPVFVALLLFNYIISPVDEVINYLSNAVSRTFEFQADGFAVQLGRSEKLKEALLALDKENKSCSNVDSWYSAYHYSHPPLVERLKAIDASAVKDTKKTQ